MSLLPLNTNNSNIINNNNNNTTPSSWKFLGSVSSVSPINKLLDQDDLKLTTTSTKIYNGTGYFTEDVDENDMLNDLQTISLACLATLVPLIIVLMVLFGLRFLLGKYQHIPSRRRNNLNDSSIFSSNLHETAKETSSSIPLHTHLLNDLDSTETHHRIEICSTTETSSVQMEMLEENVSISTNNFCNNSNHRPNTNNANNGSIITMTLKNNHLIVETEERNDIQEDSKETTVRYSPSTDNGIFVVEVQQGMRKSPSNSSATPDERPSSSLMRTDECAIVHNPPESDNDAEEEEEEKEAKIVKISSRKANTGLTSSAISLDSLRRNYCYNNNQFSGYDLGNFGYSVYSGYDVAENSMNNNDSQQIIAKKITSSNKNNVDEENFSNKPKIMSALYKSNKKTMNFNSANLNTQEKLLIEQIDQFDQEQQQQELSSDFYADK